MNINAIKEKVEKEKEWLINVRRDLHKHPELGQEEFRTMEKICEYLQEMGISYKDKVFKTGVIAEIKGEDQGYTIALRADIDALPIIDKKILLMLRLMKENVMLAGMMHTRLLH